MNKAQEKMSQLVYGALIVQRYKLDIINEGR
jgi:hypothetical protein